MEGVRKVLGWRIISSALLLRRFRQIGWVTVGPERGMWTEPRRAEVAEVFSSAAAVVLVLFVWVLLGGGVSFATVSRLRVVFIAVGSSRFDAMAWSCSNTYKRRCSDGKTWSSGRRAEEANSRMRAWVLARSLDETLLRWKELVDACLIRETFSRGLCRCCR